MCVAKRIFGVNSNLDTDVANRDICPVEIKLLAVLRILGRNWNFDDIAEATLMGKRLRGELSTSSAKTLCYSTTTNMFSGQKMRNSKKLWKRLPRWVFQGV